MPAACASPKMQKFIPKPIQPTPEAPLGLIAGSGDLPREIIRLCRKQGIEVFVIAFEGITDPFTVDDVAHTWMHIGSVGEIIQELKNKNVEHLLLAGKVGRPSPSALKLDFTAFRLLSRFTKLSSF